MSNAHDPQVSVEQAAELLGTDARTVRQLIAEGRLEFVKVGRNVRVMESTLIRYATGIPECGNSATAAKRRSA